MNSELIRQVRGALVALVLVRSKRRAFTPCMHAGICRRPIFLIGIGTVIFIIASVQVEADFFGRDSLSADSGNLERFTSQGNGLLAFRNSRLEFLVSKPAQINTAIGIWLPNLGNPNKAWYVQVDAHIDKPTIPAESFLDLGLTIESDTAGAGPCATTFLRSNFNDMLGTDVNFKSDAVVVDAIGYKSNDVTLRIHYDPVLKQLVSSFHDGKFWFYSKPVNIESWGMRSHNVFYTSLYARNGGETARGLALDSGPAYFKNFRCGPASPEIVVFQPAASQLEDGKDTLAYKTVTIGGRRAKTFYILNYGTMPLQNIALRLVGPNRRDFIITSHPSSDVVRPGYEARFSVAFRPKAAGVRKAQLQIISSDDSDTSFDIKLSGYGK